METVDKEFLTTAESYSLLGVSKSYFFRLKKESALPVFTVGTSEKKNLFKRSDVLGLIKQKG